MFSSAGMAGDEQVIAAAKEMFSKFAAGDRSAIHPNIRGSVFSMNLKYGGQEEVSYLARPRYTTGFSRLTCAQYQTVLDFSRTAETSDQRNSALRTLGQSRQMIPQTLELLLSGKIRDQDIYLPIGGLRSSREGIEGLFGWMTNNWDAIYKKFPKESTMIGSIVAYSVGGLSTQKQLDAVEQFFGNKSKAGFDRSLAQATDSVRARVTWTERDNQDLRQWLGIA
jgi:aminopeptidase 2